MNHELTEAARWSEYFDSLAPNGDQVIATVQLLGQQVTEVNGIQSLLREITARSADDPERPAGITGRWWSLASDFVLTPVGPAG